MNLGEYNKLLSSSTSSFNHSSSLVGERQEGAPPASSHNKPLSIK